MLRYIMRTCFRKIWCDTCKKWQPYMAFIFQSLPPEPPEYFCRVCFYNDFRLANNGREFYSE